MQQILWNGERKTKWNKSIAFSNAKFIRFVFSVDSFPAFLYWISHLSIPGETANEFFFGSQKAQYSCLAWNVTRLCVEIWGLILSGVVMICEVNNIKTHKSYLKLRTVPSLPFHCMDGMELCQLTLCFYVKRADLLALWCCTQHRHLQRGRFCTCSCMQKSFLPPDIDPGHTGIGGRGILVLLARLLSTNSLSLSADWCKSSFWFEVRVHAFGVTNKYT